LSSNIIDYLRVGSKGARQDINKILAELQDLNAQDPEDAALQERIGLWDSRRLKTSSLELAGAANQISNAGPRRRRTDEFTMEMPTTCQSFPNTVTENGTFTFPAGVEDQGVKYGGRGEFGGTNEYISLSNSVGSDMDLERTSAFSIAAWFKAPTISVIPSIVTKSVGFGDELGYKFYTGSTGRLAFKLSNGSASIAISISTPEVDDSLWNSVVATYSGNSNRSGMKMYINKTLEVTGTALALTGTTINTEATGIGATGAGLNKLTGQLAHVILIKEELTQTWINNYHDFGHYDFSAGNMIFHAPFVGNGEVFGEATTPYCVTS